ncbi:Protein of unknown function [Cotesia congregata]|uniref:Uncharacterized protein n=1 Tax=Cotesia congregata TaxID=51543 RepID=A0A8J2HJG3_COTCN|nr:Protein of unknown function [Cotesia congregata]
MAKVRLPSLNPTLSSLASAILWQTGWPRLGCLVLAQAWIIIGLAKADYLVLAQAWANIGSPSLVAQYWARQGPSMKSVSSRRRQQRKQHTPGDDSDESESDPDQLSRSRTESSNQLDTGKLKHSTFPSQNIIYLEIKGDSHWDYSPKFLSENTMLLQSY